jgi:hypothetical protein
MVSSCQVVQLIFYMQYVESLRIIINFIFRFFIYAHISCCRKNYENIPILVLIIKQVMSFAMKDEETLRTAIMFFEFEHYSLFAEVHTIFLLNSKCFLTCTFKMYISLHLCRGFLFNSASFMGSTSDSAVAF